MKTAAVRETGFSSRKFVVAAAACAACAGAWAQQADLTVAQVDIASIAARNDSSMPRIELSRSTMPRLEGLDSATSGPRLDLTVIPPRRSLGLAVGMSGFSPPPQALVGQPSPPVNVDVGLTYRHTDSVNQVDVTAWRRLNPQPDAYTLVQHQQTAYVTRVEWNLGAGTSSSLVADRGFLGMQLESGARLGVKRKDGGAMLYYRKKF